MPVTEIAVIPAQAGIQFVGLTALKINQMNNLDSGLRRNDGRLRGRYSSFPRSSVVQGFGTLERPGRGSHAGAWEPVNGWLGYGAKPRA